MAKACRHTAKGLWDSSDKLQVRNARLEKRSDQLCGQWSPCWLTPLGGLRNGAPKVEQHLKGEARF